MERLEESENEQLSENDLVEPIKFIKIRKDLQGFFEVVNHSEGLLKCKLAGTDSCKMDGEMGALKYSARRGWFNFVRHLKRAHKQSVLLEERFEKRIHNKSNTMKAVKGQTEDKHEDRQTAECLPSSSGAVENKWKNLLSKDRHCLICLGVCAATRNDEDIIAEEHFKLKKLFPGCEGNLKLSQHLFYIFFLRKIVEFPGEACEEFLKKCRGLRMPETWFSLCSTCRNIILQAADISKQLNHLQTKFSKLKALTKARFQKDPLVSLSKIEEEIRGHIFACSDATNNNYQPEFVNVSSFDDDKSPSINLDEEECSTLSLKVENKINESSSESFSRSRRQFPPRNYVEMEYDSADFLDDNGTDDKVENVLHDSVCSNALAIVKIEQDTSTHDSLETDMNKETKKKLTAEDESLVDSDFVVEPTEISNLDSDDSDFTPKESIVKRKRIHQFSFVRKRSAHFSKKSILNVKSEGRPLKKSSTLYVCQFCPSKYRNNRSLQDHLEAHEISKAQDNTFDCYKCGYPCHSEKTKNQHIKIKHGREEGHPCSLCDFKPATQKQYYLHFQEHRKEAEKEKVNGKYFCKLCNRLFISYEVLCRHKRVAHYAEIGVTPLKCEYCSLILSTKKLLQDHIQQTHKKQSKYFCELCGKGMLYMSKLRRHMNAHSKERRYVCDLCGADFSYNETLKNHIKKEHPESMNEHGNGSSLRDPLAMSHKFTCKHCDIEFASSTLLNRHLKTHAELFAHKCDLCGKGYATPQSLRRHKEIKHTKGEVPCTFCGKKFVHQEYIRSHYRFCKNHPKRKQPVALTGEPLQKNHYNESSETTASANDILEAAITSSCLEKMQGLKNVETGTPSIPVHIPDQRNDADIEYQNIQKTQTNSLDINTFANVFKYDAGHSETNS